LQVRWDCPPEYVEYQAAPPPAAPPTTTTGLVSGYDTESDNEEEEEEVMDVEKKPDFIGPRIPEVCTVTSVADPDPDPDPHGSAFILVSWIQPDPHWEYRSGSRRAKMTHKSEEIQVFKC
jgi:hypothetical protein